MLRNLFQAIKAQLASVKYLRVEDEDLISRVIDVITDQLNQNYGNIMKITTKKVCGWLRSKGVEAQPSTIGRILAALHRLGFLKYAGRHGTYKVYFVQTGSWNPTRACNMIMEKMQA